MVRERYTEEQTIAVLQESEAGTKVTEPCPKHGMSEATCYNWMRSTLG